MIQGTAKLVIDLGNSETRVITIFGTTLKGNPRKRVSQLDNMFSDIADDYVIPQEYDSSNSKVFVKDGVKFCNGSLCRMEFASFSMRPTAIEKKYNSTITDLSLTLALMHGMEVVAEMANTTVDNLDIVWSVYLMLPPADIAIGAPLLIEKVKKITKLDFSMPEVKIGVEIDSVKVLPEGFCAFLGVVFDKHNKVREEYASLLSETTMVIDIGAGTTDINIIQQARNIENSRFTANIGGNNVHQKVRKALAEKGISLPDDVVQRGVIDGYVKDGAKKISIVNEICVAKDLVAKSLVSAIRDNFEDSQFPIRTIENLLVCGGGALEGNHEGIKSTGEFLITYMRRLSENISMVTLPVDGEGESASPISPRLLNVNGAAVAALK